MEALRLEKIKESMLDEMVTKIKREKRRKRKEKMVKKNERQSARHIKQNKEEQEPAGEEIVMKRITSNKSNSSNLSRESKTPRTSTVLLPVVTTIQVANKEQI